jgi:hypothetical protein
MESNQGSSKNNNLWIGELEQSMDENYLKQSCQKYSNSIKNIYNIYLIS